MNARVSSQRFRGGFTAAIIALALIAGSAQTRITPPNTKYSPADDVKLGLQAAEEAKKELPLLHDERVDQYVDAVGQRLVAAIPPEFQHPEFKYSFDVVNQKEINAFALPGGPMFLNRGMMEAAKSEAEMAGVMAHELSHVALRHGTAQATKGEKFQIGAIAGQVLGAIVGGTAGSVIAQGSQFGLGAYFMKFSREYESQADILGAQMLARAGYNPRDMANMFKTIEAQGGGGGPEWLSDHPNPGNRYEAILKEASMLQVQPRADVGQLSTIQARLQDSGPAYTAEQIAKGQAGNKAPTANAPSSSPQPRAVAPVDPPARQLRTFTPAKFLRVGVPSNWSPATSDSSGVTYTPKGAFFQAQNGQTAFTHGVQFGVTQGTGNLQRDTQALLQGLARSNPNLRQQGNYRRDSLGGRSALSATLSNVSDVTGQPEYITITTASLTDGNILYMVGVAPQSEARAYDQAFRQVRQSVSINTNAR
jgi:Zn-dependent protease with chaperone function